MSASPLIARQIPIREGEKVTGFVDLALERAYHYRPGKPSEQIDIPADLADREAQDRFHMLEQLADHDDALLEQLLMDETPDRATVFADLASETGENLIVPVLFGSALNGFGVRRLMKALRHDAPAPEAAAERLGAKRRLRLRVQGHRTAARWAGSRSPGCSAARSAKAPSSRRSGGEHGPGRHPVRDAGREDRQARRGRGRRRRRHRQGRRASMPANGSAPAARRRRRSTLPAVATTRSPSPPATARTTSACRPRSTS